MFRVIRLPQCVLFLLLRHEVKRENLLNLRIKLAEEKKLKSISLVMATDLGQVQHGNPGFPALTCGHMMQYQRGRRCKLVGKCHHSK